MNFCLSNPKFNNISDMTKYLRCSKEKDPPKKEILNLNFSLDVLIKKGGGGAEIEKTKVYFMFYSCFMLFETFVERGKNHQV